MRRHVASLELNNFKHPWPAGTQDLCRITHQNYWKSAITSSVFHPTVKGSSPKGDISYPESYVSTLQPLYYSWRLYNSTEAAMGETPILKGKCLRGCDSCTSLVIHIGMTYLGSGCRCGALGHGERRGSKALDELCCRNSEPSHSVRSAGLLMAPPPTCR